MSEIPQPYLPLNDGNAIPQFGLGVFQVPPPETAALVRDAIAVGYRAVDTAAGYANEAGVGEALAGRDDVFLTTKLRNSDHGFDATLRAFDASAELLGRESVDLYLIYWPCPQRGRYVETWQALVRLKLTGQAKSIGVSNFTVACLERIIDETGIAPAVNQIELHPRFQQRELRAFHDTHGIRTESWSPLGRGRHLNDPVLVDIAAKHGKTPAQVTLRWHLENDLIIIPKTIDRLRLRENIAALEFRLDAEDLARIATLDLPSGRIGPDPDVADF